MALRYKSEGPGIDSRCRRGFFSVASDSSMCPGVDSASKNDYQVNPGGKSGRCVRLTTYHLHVPMSRKSGGLNLLEPCGPVQACNGTALPLPLPLQIEWAQDSSLNGRNDTPQQVFEKH
jgi:hypothetical protein